VHIIPRRKGDVPDPRGGIRWILDEKAKLLGQIIASPAPAEQIRFLTNVQGLLADGLFTATYKYDLCPCISAFSTSNMPSVAQGPIALMCSPAFRSPPDGNGFHF
jgi:hypothetical protein